MARKKKKAKFRYYPEEVLIDYVQRGMFSWVDYVRHYSEEWRREFNEFCAERHMPINNDTALAYITFREDLLEDAMEQGHA